MNIALVWQTLASVAAVAIAVQCICNLNAMDRRTDHRIRLSFLGLLIGAGAIILEPLYLAAPATWHEALLATMLAVFLACNRRRGYVASAAPA